MAGPLTRLQARIAGQLARERMGERFATQKTYEGLPVAGPGLARVAGQLANSTVGEEYTGDVVSMTNIGRPAVALYAPDGSAFVVSTRSSTGQSGGGTTTAPSTNKPYATVVVASKTSPAEDRANADYVCDGIDDQVEINAALATPPAAGLVLLLDGTYNITASINIASHVILAGLGSEATTLMLSASQPIAAIVAVDLAAYFQIAKLTITSNAGATKLRTAVAITRATNFHLEDLDISYCSGHAITAAVADTFVIDSCTINTAGGSGIEIQDAQAGEIRNCAIQSPGQYGIDLHRARIVTVADNRIKQCGADGIRVGKL